MSIFYLPLLSTLFLFLSPLFSLQIILFFSVFFFVLLSMFVLDFIHLFLKNYSLSVILHSIQWPEMLTHIIWAVSRVSVTFWLPCGSVNGNPRWVTLYHIMGFLGGTVAKNPSANAGDARDTGLIPGLERSPGAGNVYPLQYSCLKNSMDREAWWVTVCGVAESDMTEDTRTYSVIETPLPSCLE